MLALSIIETVSEVLLVSFLGAHDRDSRRVEEKQQNRQIKGNTLREEMLCVYILQGLLLSLTHILYFKLFVG